LITDKAAAAPLAVTMGEPAGIGMDVAIDAWRKRDGLPPFYLIAPPSAVLARSALLGYGIRTQSIADPAEVPAIFEKALPILPIEAAIEVSAGEPRAASTGTVMESIERAVTDALSGAASGIVTTPINKKVLQESGFLYPGHTEYLAALCRNRKAPAFKGPVMMLAAGDLRVVPLTIHIPLKDVPAALSSQMIVDKALVTVEALRRDFGIAQPRLAVAALNPHAGEGGQMGLEEQSLIIPAITRLRNLGLEVHGPFPADTMFHEAARATYDAALCMYHDQALIPLKTLDFWRGVNVTLGLPVIRTSPDHGTAFSLAGTGKANPDSMLAAIRMAADIARNRASSRATAGAP